jgi:hypothetical protein
MQKAQAEGPIIASPRRQYKANEDSFNPDEIRYNVWPILHYVER